MIRLLIACALAIPAGCTSAPPPERHLYLLDTTPPSEAYPANLVVGLSRISVADYLKRSEIMLQIGPNEVRPAAQHRWAEPLEDGIRRYLRARLSSELQTNVDTNLRRQSAWRWQVEVVIDTLHGSTVGSVTLAAHYYLTQPGANDGAPPTHHGTVAVQQDQDGVGYPALVVAHTRLLDLLARRIAGDVDRAPHAGD